ncbi:hypothetical protein HMPREF9945_01897 [Clostridioides difficile 70-100-2010]|nr:hypothetical protein HMPREF9945_01897 [Clostridioides difficile 70-100-2010]
MLFLFSIIKFIYPKQKIKNIFSLISYLFVLFYLYMGIISPHY